MVVMKLNSVKAGAAGSIALPLAFLFVGLCGRLWAGEIQVWRPEKAPVNGVVIVAHGLNVKPSKMGDAESEGTIVKALLDGGYTVVCAALSGHSGPVETMKSVTEAAWLADAYACYLAARAEADRAESLSSGLRTPLYLAGFSLGALLFEAILNEATETPVRFDGAVLFSPALAIKGSAYGVLLLKSAREGDRGIVKSMSPSDYRAQDGASIAAYKALFALEKRLNAQSFAKNNIPTLVFISPRDEIVSQRKLESLIKKFALTNWTLKTVSNKGASIRPLYNHLIIDDRCLGKENWELVRRAMLDFLDAQAE
jgi:alpha-beta hydrolase superfamily lysophospholipase